MGNWTQPRRPADKPAFPEFEEWVKNHCPLTPDEQRPGDRNYCSHALAHGSISSWSSNYRDYIIGVFGEVRARTIWTNGTTCRTAYEKHKGSA